MAEKCMKTSSSLSKDQLEAPALRIAELETSNDLPDIKSHPKASTTARLRATRGRTLHEHALPELTSLIDPASIFRLNDLPVPGTRIRLELQGRIRRKDETLRLRFGGCKPVTGQLGAECSAALLVLLHGANEVLHHDVAEESMSITGPVMAIEFRASAHAFAFCGRVSGLARTSIASSVRVSNNMNSLRFFDDVLVEDLPLKASKRI